jgi:hypothetical protein
MIFSVATARQYAHEGRLDEWLHAYLNIPAWANPRLSQIIRHQRPLWVGPIEVGLSQLVRCCGPEEGMRFRKDVADWERDIAAILDGLHDPHDLPPLIVRPQIGGVFGLADGNHRHEAMRRKQWHTGWALIWCDRDECFRGSWSTGESSH